jgi:hypothetical protein
VGQLVGVDVRVRVLVEVEDAVGVLLGDKVGVLVGGTVTVWVLVRMGDGVAVFVRV